MNGICDDATTLSGKVDSILAETFDGVVEKSMLSEALADEIDAKATQTALAAVSDDVTAEAAARESADTALDTRVDALETELPQKCEVAVGSYAGNGTYPRTIELGYHPRCVFIATPNGPVATESESYSMLIVDTTDTVCAA